MDLSLLRPVAVVLNLMLLCLMGFALLQMNLAKLAEDPLVLLYILLVLAPASALAALLKKPES